MKTHKRLCSNSMLYMGLGSMGVGGNTTLSAHRNAIITTLKPAHPPFYKGDVCWMRVREG